MCLCYYWRVLWIIWIITNHLSYNAHHICLLYGDFRISFNLILVFSKRLWLYQLMAFLSAKMVKYRHMLSASTHLIFSCFTGRPLCVFHLLSVWTACITGRQIDTLFCVNALQPSQQVLIHLNALFVMTVLFRFNSQLWSVAKCAAGTVDIFDP